MLMLTLSLCAALLTMLLWAAICDFRARRVPNASCVGVAALWPAYLALSDGLPHAAGALLGAAGVFATGFLLWRRGILGGGDVKLLSALALWAGGSLLLPFLLLTALLGGVLALVWLHARHASLLLPLRVTTGLSRAGLPTLPGDEQSLPYGVAVSFAGIWLTHRLFWS